MTRSVVVTGCGRGIGRSIAARLLADGWAVVGVELDPACVAELEESGLAAVVAGDVSVPDTHAKAVDRAVAIAPLRGWVNNAAIVGETPLHDPDPEVVERTVAVNLLGCFWGCSAAVRAFIACGDGGAIVNISSVHAQRAVRADTAPYDASKAGIEALTRYVSVAYGHRGIRANAIAPAGVRTPMFDEYAAAASDPAALKREVAASHPLGRIAEPQEIAAAASFLLNDESSFVTGIVLGVDGGVMACGQPFTSD